MDRDWDTPKVQEPEIKLDLTVHNDGSCTWHLFTKDGATVIHYGDREVNEEIAIHKAKEQKAKWWANKVKETKSIFI